jgi:Mg-chelatase subunit ChlD
MATLQGSASAVAAPNTYSPPVWLPVRGDHQIGCAWFSTGTCGGTYHEYPAIDIKSNLRTSGEQAYAAGAGRVVSAIGDQGNNCDHGSRPLSSCSAKNHELGNSVTIYHGGGVFSYYQHFASVDVKVGDWVDQNDKIGKVGDSGWSDRGFFHVHYERRVASKSCADAVGSDPLKYQTCGPVKADPGKIKGCVGSTVKTYPDNLLPSPGYPTWRGIPGHKFTAHSDGSACVVGAGGGGTGGKPKVDLVFVLDTTGSMGLYIGAAKAAATTITNALFSKADARVALVDYKDLYASCPFDGYAARVDLEFSTSPAAFSTALAPLTASGGCDAPESVYSGLMAGIDLPWRPGVQKSLILIGDAPPHDPEPTTGLTRTKVSAAARAVDPASIYSINLGGGGSPFFEGLADDTGGKVYPASDPSTAIDKVLEAITTIVDSGLTANAGGPYVGVAGDLITFDATGSVAPAGVNVRSYEWDYDNDGTYDETTAVATVSHVYSAPYDGDIGLRVTTDQTPANSVATTAKVTVFTPTSLKYTGQRAGKAGDTVHLQSFLYQGHDTPVPGVHVTMSVGTATCIATTNSNGKANCDVVLPAADTTTTVYAESALQPPYYLSATSEKFNVS